MTFGERLRQARTKLGIKQKDFAEALGVGYNDICRYEKNVSTPKQEFLINLWKRYKININWLLTGSNGVDENE